jgi:hypothetical protein
VRTASASLSSVEAIAAAVPLRDGDDDVGEHVWAIDTSTGMAEGLVIGATELDYSGIMRLSICAILDSDYVAIGSLAIASRVLARPEARRTIVHLRGAGWTDAV